ncbi:MAG: type II toxin-antitoxin system VapB family antitoxin [Rhizobiaceae bacterium]|jgi:antitoxin VapB
MALSIKNPDVERMARELSRRRGVSVTEAIRQSLEREVERERRIPRHAPGELAARLMVIAERAAALPRVSDLTDDEILGYDEFGVPELPASMRKSD